MKKAVKSILKPFQEILIKKKLCVGCTAQLSKAEIKTEFDDNHVLVQCKCTRRYILDKQTGLYRRATFEEDVEYMKKRHAQSIA
jgi:hypothetical protein